MEFCEFLLDSPKRRSQIVEILRTAAEWSAFIPGFSLEKLYGPYVRELSDEMDTYANRNYDVTFNSVVLLCVSITLVVTVAAPNKDIPGFIVSIPHSGFYFGVASFFLYVVLVFAWVFARNAYQQQKRAFLKDFLASIAEPIQNPERIDDEYLTHLLESFKIISGKKDKPATKKAHEKMRRLIRLAMDIRS